MSEVYFKLINDCVVVKLLLVEDKIVGGIIILDMVKEKLQQGEIVVVGLGKEGVKLIVNVGDWVFYGKYVG